MKILVTYKSKTEFTKKYAEMIAKEVDGCLVEFKKMTAEKMFNAEKEYAKSQWSIWAAYVKN